LDIVHLAAPCHQVRLTFTLDRMNTVYLLRDDPATVEHMQAGSLSAGPIGLKQTHGLVGSPEWWSHVEDGSLPVFRREGMITGFWPGQWQQGPASFELSLDGGGVMRELCNLEPREAALVFRVGRRAMIEFVAQELKTEFQGSRTSNVVIRISVDGAHAA
jgi:hypothetical protein